MQTAFCTLAGTLFRKSRELQRMSESTVPAFHPPLTSNVLRGFANHSGELQACE